ncbi:hypothetical protein [Streptomyces sp. NPDC047525]|uniref:hypothetical protein n=1 Tax=Streptomyces sp. NPDC047525 TaxID=3155264 RepID=UPI0034072E5B
MRTTRHTLLAATAAVILVAGCSGSSDDGQDAAPPKQPPTATGTGPEPSPGEAEQLPAGKKGTPRGSLPAREDIDQKDATAVSKAALTVMHSYDTAIDTSRNDAGRRVADAGWCTGTYAAQLREAASRSNPGAAWSTWAQHKAYTKPAMQRTEESGQPADTDTEAYRQWTITVTPTGRKGWKGTPEISTAYVALTRAAADDPWRLAAVTVQ